MKQSMESLVDSLQELITPHDCFIVNREDFVVKVLAILYGTIIDMQDRVDTLEYEKRQLEDKLNHLEYKID